jgi:hypothetical protein
MIGNIRICKCGKDCTHKYEYDLTKSVQFRTDTCLCGFKDEYITWQR